MTASGRILARLEAYMSKEGRMTDDEIAAAKAEIAKIDEWFENATGWGSWMVSRANDRERLVNRLNASGIPTEHKWQARCGGHPTD